MIFSKTRKLKHIDQLYERGLSISYKSVLQIGTDVANAEIDGFEKFVLFVPQCYALVYIR